MAGPQVGLDRAVAVLDCAGMQVALLNPLLFEVVYRESMARESCLSVPRTAVAGAAIGRAVW